MNAVATTVSDVPALEHEDAMPLAAAEYERVLALVDELDADDWSRPTDCTGWDVKAILGHLLGEFELLADRAEGGRQVAAAAQVAQETGCLHIDALTGLHVKEHAHLSPADVVKGLHATAPRALAGRRDTTDEERQAPYPTGIPGEGVWTRGYLIDVILTRDPWIHRVDICRATGRTMVLTAEHDGRIVADVVTDWARRHGQPFTLTLDGPAGAIFTTPDPQAQIRVDAVEFCRILSGRGAGEGLLTTRIAF